MDNVIVYNLLNDAEYIFDACTVPEYAVAYAYCAEHNLMSAFYNAVHENTLTEFFTKYSLPFVRARHSVACGDWVAKQ